MARGHYRAGHPRLGWILSNYAFTVGRNHRQAQAEPLFREAVEVYREAFGSLHRHVARCLDLLGSCLMNQGKFREARQPLREAADISEELFGPDDPRTVAKRDKLAKAQQKDR